MKLRGMSTSHRKIIQKCVGNNHVYFCNPKITIVLINHVPILKFLSSFTNSTVTKRI